jgi:hypothetical protein
VTRTERAAWAAHHRRGDVLRAVVDHADQHRDGLLSDHVPGVLETFRDTSDLVSALQLRWHTHLTGRIERALMERPTDLETAVVAAWREAADELAGVRLVLDRAAAEPVSDELATALHRAAVKDRVLLAAMAGLAAPDDPEVARLGRALEELARAGWRPGPPAPRPGRGHRDGTASRSLVGRLKAVLAA